MAAAAAAAAAAKVVEEAEAAAAPPQTNHAPWANTHNGGKFRISHLNLIYNSLQITLNNFNFNIL